MPFVLVLIQLVSHVWFYAFPMHCSMPGFPVLHYLPEFAQIYVHWVDEAINLTSSVAPFSSCLLSFPGSGSFPVSQLLAGGRSIRSPASASVLPMNILGWFPLGLTSLICLQSKGLSRVFSNTTVQRHQFFALSFCYGPTLTSIPDYWKNHSFD